MAKNEKRVVSRFDEIPNSNHEWRRGTNSTPIES
jgi:hypothetical protein